MDNATRRRILVAATVGVAGVVVVALAVLASRRPAESVAADAPPPAGSVGVTPAPTVPGPTVPPTEETGPSSPAPGSPGACAGGALPRPAAGEPTDADQQAVSAAVAGCAEADVQHRAEAAGWTVRVMHRDGEDLIGTMDFRTDRLNLDVEQGTVTGAGIG
jgi:hypothetical protein